MTFSSQKELILGGQFRLSSLKAPSANRDIAHRRQLIERLGELFGCLGIGKTPANIVAVVFVAPTC
jgi:hypothetical protein